MVASSYFCIHDRVLASSNVEQIFLLGTLLLDDGSRESSNVASIYLCELLDTCIDVELE